MFQAGNQIAAVDRAAPGIVSAVNTWFDYRRAWAVHPWLLAYAALVIVVFAMAVVGTFASNALAILFIPSLAGAYVHHMMVMKRTG